MSTPFSLGENCCDGRLFVAEFVMSKIRDVLLLAPSAVGHGRVSATWKRI